MKKAIFILLFSLIMGEIHAQSWETLNAQGIKLRDEKKYTEALVIFQKAKILAEKDYGKNSENYLNSVTTVARLYNEQKK